MNYRIILYILGYVLKFEALFLTLPCVIDGIYREDVAWPYAFVAMICLITGILLTIKKPKNTSLFTRDGLATVALSWIVMGIFGAIPLVLTGEIPAYEDALFEVISGFTTTGASILGNVEELSHATMFWRSFTHWIGGMGVFVFIVAILPMLGSSTMQLVKAESPGPSVDKLVPHVRDSAKILYEIYVAITVSEIIALIIAGMPAFDSFVTTFGTVGTGGFGIKNDSIASYNDAIQIIVTIFMILSGVNYTAFFCLVSHRAKDAFKFEEVRWYFGIIFLAATIISINTYSLYNNAFTTIKNAFFQVGSIITTTGYSTVDFDLWPELSKTIIVLLMFIGACAGSTGGGIKVSRILVMFKTIKKEVHTMIHERAITKVRMDGHAVAHEVVRAINVFFAVYIAVFFSSLLLISIDEFSFETNFTAVSAALNNIGPGLAGVGPTKNFADYSAFSKIILILDMVAGRLELFPVLILFNIKSWRRS